MVKHQKNLLGKLMDLVGGYRDHGFDYSAANKAQGLASNDAPSLKNMLLWGVVGVLVLAVLVFLVDRFVFSGQVTGLLLSLVGADSDGFTGCKSKKDAEDKYSKY